MQLFHAGTQREIEIRLNPHCIHNAIIVQRIIFQHVREKAVSSIHVKMPESLRHSDPEYTNPNEENKSHRANYSGQRYEKGTTD